MPPPVKAATKSAVPSKAGAAAAAAVVEPVVEVVAAAAPVVIEVVTPPLPLSEEKNGRFVFDDGSIYEGDYLFTRIDGLKKRHGQGRFMGKHFSYEGGWVDDGFHGYGTFIGGDGASYTGNFDSGTFHGINGKYKFPDGASYDGAWFRNQMHGPGHYVAPDGVLFAGDFHLGLFVRGRTHVAVR
jgi:radial spoke head protein 1